MTTEGLPTLHDRVPELAGELAERGSLGVMALDVSSMGVVEDEYGSDAYAEVRRRLFKILAEQRGKDFRGDDVLALDEPRGLQIILFLDRKRRRSNPTTIADVKLVRSRLMASLAPALARAAFPYIKSPPPVEVGYAMAVHNPLIHPERILPRGPRESASKPSTVRSLMRMIG